jgi:hypothetical protein
VSTWSPPRSSRCDLTLKGPDQVLIRERLSIWGHALSHATARAWARSRTMSSVISDHADYAIGSFLPMADGREIGGGRKVANGLGEVQVSQMGLLHSSVPASRVPVTTDSPRLPRARSLVNRVSGLCPVVCPVGARSCLTSRQRLGTDVANRCPVCPESWPAGSSRRREDCVGFGRFCVRFVPSAGARGHRRGPAMGGLLYQFSRL